MPQSETEKSKSAPKKARLGRGIGSLLTENNANFLDDEVTLEETNEKVEVEHFSKAAPTMPKPKPIIKNNDPKIIEKVKVVEKIVEKIVNGPNTMAVEKIIANKNQPRKFFNAEALKELSLSIKEKGLLQPIVIKKISENSYEIIAGERRFRAAKLAGVREVPVIIREADEKETLELALIENIQRKDLNPIEEAKAYKNLMDKFSMTQDILAKRLGKNRATIANLLRLLKLSPLVQDMVINERISMGHAKVLLSVTDLIFQEKLAKMVMEKKLSVRDLEVLSKSKAKVDNANAVEEVDISKKLVKKLSEEIQKIIGTKVDIDYNKGKGKIKISYYSDEELNQFVDNLRDSWTR